MPWERQYMPLLRSLAVITVRAAINMALLTELFVCATSLFFFVSPGGDQRAEAVEERTGVGGADEVLLFVGVGLEVVEFFRSRVADAVFAVKKDGGDGAGGVRVPGGVIDALADERELGAGWERRIRTGRDGRGEGIAGDAARRDFKQVEDRGGEIAESDHLADALASGGTVG